MQSWMIGMVSGTIFAGIWPMLPPWSLSFPLVGIALFALRRRSWLAMLVSGLACGCTLGLLSGTLLLHQRLADDCVGVPLTVSGRVASLPAQSRMPGDVRRQRFTFSVSDISPPRCRGPSEVVLSYYGDESISPGEAWQFEVRLKKPWGMANPGSFNMQVWFAQEGIDGVGSVRESRRTHRLRWNGRMYAIHHRVRMAISERIGALGLSPDIVAMLRAITVAEKSGLGQQLWHLLQVFGINHLLVISGLHVGLVAGAGYLFGGLFLRLFPWVASRGAWLPGVMALSLASFYAALAGFSLPVQRALCMLACFVGAGLAARSNRAANSLLLAATVVLTINPLAALGSGFWLSFGAVAALLWLARWQQGEDALRRLFSTQVFLSLVMLPMGALFFGGGSVVAVLANLLMIPLIGMLVVPLSLLAVLSFLCGLAVESQLWRLAAWPLQQILPLMNALADSGDEWLFLQLTAALPEVILALLAVVLLMLPGVSVLKLLVPLLLLPLFLPPVQSARPTLDTAVTVLDVGQGTAVVVRSGNRALLYDTGGGDPRGMNMGKSVVLPYLRKLGVVSLDTLVISHPDLDHSAGTGALLEAMQVQRFRYGGANPGYSVGRPCISGEAWRWPGGQVFQILSPAKGAPPSRNDGSCVLQIQVGEYRLLLPGDIEKGQEQILVRYWGDLLGSDWLLAAHHGSGTSTSPAFLKRVTPAHVVISSGYANRFGHPHPLVLQRLRQPGVQIYSTAADGALEFELLEGEVLQVSAFRQVWRRYWM